MPFLHFYDGTTLNSEIFKVEMCNFWKILLQITFKVCTKVVKADGCSLVIRDSTGSLPSASQNAVYLDQHTDKDPRVVTLVLYPHSLEFANVGWILESALASNTFIAVCRAVVFLSFPLCTNQGEEIGSGGGSSMMCTRTSGVCNLVVY